MAYISTEENYLNSAGSSNLGASPTHQSQLEGPPAVLQSADKDVQERLQLAVKVVPLARPYLSFGPASSQLLREQSEVQLYALPNLLSCRRHPASCKQMHCSAVSLSTSLHAWNASLTFL